MIGFVLLFPMFCLFCIVLLYSFVCLILSVQFYFVSVCSLSRFVLLFCFCFIFVVVLVFSFVLFCLFDVTQWRRIKSWLTLIVTGDDNWHSDRLVT